MTFWETLSEIARTLLIMSATGGIIALILFALRPIIKNNIPKSAQYYLWVLVLVAFLIPFSAFVSLPFATPMVPLQEALDENVKTTVERREEIAQKRYGMEYEVLDAQEQIDISFNEIGLMNGRFLDYVLSALITMGGVLFLIDIVQYAAYTVKLRRKRIAAKNNEARLLNDLCKDGKCPRLYRNALAPTPMLLGIFHPVIYLPDREYSEQHLQNIMLHELMHLRRHDVVVKWISAVAVYVHWFNPVAYLVRREIDRACELACDEAVINGLDNEGKQSYGDTLIEMASGAKAHRMVVSTTMCEEKKTLKDRLGAIMKGKKATKAIILFSCALLLVALGVIVILGSSGKRNHSEFIRWTQSVSTSDFSSLENQAIHRFYGTSRIAYQLTNEDMEELTAIFHAIKQNDIETRKHSGEISEYQLILRQGDRTYVFRYNPSIPNAVSLLWPDWETAEAYGGGPGNYVWIKSHDLIGFILNRITPQAIEDVANMDVEQHNADNETTQETISDGQVISSVLTALSFAEEQNSLFSPVRESDAPDADEYIKITISSEEDITREYQYQYYIYQKNDKWLVSIPDTSLYTIDANAAAIIMSAVNVETVAAPEYVRDELLSIMRENVPPEGLTLEITGAAKDDAEFLLTNMTESIVEYGYANRVERYVDGAWETAISETKEIFPENPLPLQPGEQMYGMTAWVSDNTILAPGTYRYLFLVIVKKNDLPDMPVVLEASFEIAE